MKSSNYLSCSHCLTKILIQNEWFKMLVKKDQIIICSVLLEQSSTPLSSTQKTMSHRYVQRFSSNRDDQTWQRIPNDIFPIPRQRHILQFWKHRCPSTFVQIAVHNRASYFIWFSEPITCQNPSLAAMPDINGFI